MRFLLTSAGITNASIHAALGDLGRSRLRRALEAVSPQPGRKRIGLVSHTRLGCASVPGRLRVLPLN